MYILYYFLVEIIMGFLCHAILKDKGYGTDEHANYGFIWGFLFSILGLIVCVCKHKIEKTDMIEKSSEGEDYWICPKCSSKIAIHFSTCECGYTNEEMIADEEEEETWVCPICQRRIRESITQCECGYKKMNKEDYWICPRCNAENPLFISKCYCGYVNSINNVN